MKRPSQVFSSDDRQQISQAVGTAESRTSGEIVAAVAGSSGRYDRAEDIIGLWTGLMAMLGTFALLPSAMPERGSWGETSRGEQLVALMLAVVLGFILGAVVGSRVGWLRRLFTPRMQMSDEVRARALQVFYDRRVSRTAGRSGILLYVSLYERMAAVVADQTVLEKLGQPGLDELCRELTSQLRHGSPTAALCATIASTGAQLAAVLPRASDDVNELGDTLVLID